MKSKSAMRSLIIFLSFFFLFCSLPFLVFGAGPLPVKKTVEPLALFPAGGNFQFGYLNEQGRIVLSGFEQAGDFSEGLAPVAINGAYGFIDTAGKPVIAPRYADAGSFSEGLARVKLQTLWGYVDKTGIVIIKPQFQEALEFSNGLAAVKLDDRFGAIDPKGVFIIQAAYEKMGLFSEGLIAIQQNGKWGYIDRAGTLKINPQFEAAGAFAEGLAPASLGGKWGFIDSSGQWIVQPKYQAAVSFSEGLAAVAVRKRDMLQDAATKKVMAIVERNLWGYIDKTGREMIAPDQYMNVSPFSGGRASAFKKDPFEWSGLGQFGFIDKTGAMVLTLPYRKNVGVFHNGLARVELGWRYGYIDASGKMVIPQNFTEALPFSQGLAAVAQDYKWNYINSSGEVVVQTRGSPVLNFRDGFARVRPTFDWGLMDKSGTIQVKPQFEAIAWYTDKILAGRKPGQALWGLYDWSGKELAPPQFLFVSGLTSDRAVVQKGNQYGILGADGQFVVPAEYDDCGWIYSEGLLPVSKGGKYGFIDEDGRMVFAPQYDGAVGFTSEKLCAVQIDSKWGFINRANKLVIPAQYDGTTCFSEGRAAVRVNDQWGFIDATGKIIAKPQFRQAGYFSNGLAPVKVNEKWGYIDKTGKMAVPPQYDEADPFNNGLARIRTGKHFAYVDAKGKTVWMAQPGLIAKQFAESLKPAPEGSVGVTVDGAGLRTLKANVVVDQYVRQLPEWRKLLETRLQAVSDYLEKNFKIRLAVISVLPWESPEFDERKNPDSHFMTLYDNLVYTVPPLDAEIVIGYTGQKGRGMQIGQSGFYGQHVLMLELKEDKADQETLIRECSIHEIFHLFGAFHVNDKQSVMFRKTSFDPRAGLEQWTLDPDTRRQMDLMHDYNFLTGIDGLDNEKIKQAAKVFSEGHNAEEGDNGEDYRGSFTVAEGYYSRGRRLERRGDLAGAVLRYQKAAALTSDAPDYGYYGRLGDVLFKEGRFSEGFGALHKCLTIKPDEYYWHWFLANALEEQRERDAAFVQCREGATPALAKIYQHYALNRAKPAEALAEFQQAASLAKDKAFYHYALAQALRTRGRYKEALTAFQQAVTLAPDNAYYKEWVEKVQKLVAAESK
jgi:tetratricopeptide (TPR) repeat protein